jgi:23S rRNA (adenine2503-C2)-methyltransferase
MFVNLMHTLFQYTQTLEEFFPRYQADGITPGTRIVQVQYTLLKGINDSHDDAVRLAAMAQRLRCVVNLINFNHHEGSEFQRVETDAALAFRETVKNKNILCTMRDSKGDDEGSACGQLGSMRSVELAGRIPIVARIQHTAIVTAVTAAAHETAVH